jgi:hypothetical protein
MVQTSGKKSAPTTAGDVVMLVLGAVIAFTLSLMPPLLGPMIAPALSLASSKSTSSNVRTLDGAP